MSSMLFPFNEKKNVLAQRSPSLEVKQCNWTLKLKGHTERIEILWVSGVSLRSCTVFRLQWFVFALKSRNAWHSVILWIQCINDRPNIKCRWNYGRRAYMLLYFTERNGCRIKCQNNENKNGHKELNGLLYVFFFNDSGFKRKIMSTLYFISSTFVHLIVRHSLATEKSKKKYRPLSASNLLICKKFCAHFTFQQCDQWSWFAGKCS